MQSRGMALTSAGSLFAVNDGVAILLLPCLALASRLTGLKPLLALLPLIAIGATLCLIVDDDGGDDSPTVRTALLLLSVVEVFAPVIPLALLPANAKKLGAAYGAIEVIFITVQMATLFALGWARTVGGYPAALGLLVGGYASVVCVALPVIAHTRELWPWQSFYISGGY